nr:uncharacterized protein LOC111415227 [Onthophagus taurus]
MDINSYNQNTTSSLIHGLRKIYIKLETTKNHINFINCCIRENIIPNFAKVNCKNIKMSTLNFIHKKILRVEKRKHFKTLNFCYDKLAKINRCLRERLHFLEIEEVLNFITTQTLHIKREDKRRKNLKLQILKKNQNTMAKMKTNPTDQPKNNVQFQNLTDINFTEEETNLLNKGYKFSLIPKINLPILTVELDNIIRKQPEYNKIKNDLIPHIEKAEKNIKKYNLSQIQQWKTLKNIKRKLNENNATFTKADKGAGIVILNKETYINKTEQFMSENHYVELEKNPLDTVIRKIREIINTCRSTLIEYSSHIDPNSKIVSFLSSVLYLYT